MNSVISNVFGGAGGVSLGFEGAGGAVEVVDGVDIVDATGVDNGESKSSAGPDFCANASHLS
jgi:hypothetical protein